MASLIKHKQECNEQKNGNVRNRVCCTVHIGIYALAIIFENKCL